MSRSMSERYACAGMLLNGPKLALGSETIEAQGPGGFAAESLPTPARTERVHDAGAGRANLLGIQSEFPFSPRLLFSAMLARALKSGG